MNKFIITLAFLFLAASAWWDPAWNKSREVLSDSNASLITGHLVFDTKSLISSGVMRFDCGDLRVTRDEVPVSYYLFGCNSTKSSLFFSVDNTQSDFEIWYDNPAAEKSYSSSIFTFFDNFDSYSLGSTGSPVWQIVSGSFMINNTYNSRRFMPDTAGESVATAYTPSGNFSVFAEVNDDTGTGNMGVVYGYLNSTHFYAAYLNGTSIWVREGTASRSLGAFSKEKINRLMVDVVGGSASVYANGILIGSAAYSGSSTGIYADPASVVNSTVDNFAVMPSQGVSWSLGIESSRPTLVFQFLGSESANMRTAVAYLKDQEHFIKIRTESDKSDGLVKNNQASLEWANISFNSSGYFVNSSFFEIDSDSFNFTQGKYRFDLTYLKDYPYGRKWHIIQFFENYPAVKHIIFFTANNTATASFGVTSWSSCTSYSSGTGDVICASSMHSPSGVFKSGGADFCGLHLGKIGPSYFYENFSVQSKKQYKEVFWQSYQGCGDFEEDVEISCGVDYFNCTATSIKPVKVLFYVHDTPGALARMEIPTGFSCTINGEAFTDLVDSSRINKGLNSLECFGNGNLTSFKLHLAEPYEAARFFGERPIAYSVEVTGPLSRGKIKVCGVPVLDRILPYTCSRNNMFFEGDFLEGRQTLRVYQTKSSFSYKDALGGALIPATIKRMDPVQLPLAGAKELGEPIIPPTHNTISSRRLFYSNQTSVEVLITAWRSI